MKRFAPSALTVALTALPAMLLPAVAATPPADEPVEVIVVTAAASDTLLADAPASISIIDHEQLTQSPVRDLTDILGTVEGVTISNSGNLRTVQIRGLDSAYVLKLIDGRRVDSTSSVFRGNDYDTGWVPVEAIERIEIVRGPMSSLYGSDAIGGVINIITRKGTDQWQGSASADYTAHEDSAEGDSYKLGFYAGGPLIKDRLGFKIYGSSDRRQPDSPDVNDSGQAGFGEQRNSAVNSDLSWTPDDANEVQLGIDSSEREHSGQQLSRLGWFASHNGSYDFGSTSLRAYGDQTDNDTGNITGEIHPNRSTTYNLEGLLSLPLELASQTLSLGGDYRYQQLKDPDNVGAFTGSGSDTIDVDQYALFIEDQIGLGDDLLLTLGTRLDDHQHYGSHNSPRAYLVYHLSDRLTLKGGYAEAFRAPTLLQNSPSWGSVSCGSATAGCYIVGNPDLDPETSDSFEFGAQFDGAQWQAGLTLFRTDLKDMIDISSRTKDPALAPSYPNFVGFLADGRPVFEYQNLNKVRSQGVESRLAADLQPGLSANATYTYLDAKNLSGAVELPLTCRPRHSGILSLNWLALTDLTLNAKGRFYSDQYISVPASGLNMVKKAGYSTFDLGASYDWSDSLTLRGGVLNLADVNDDRATSSDFDIEGRRYYLSLTQRF